MAEKNVEGAQGSRSPSAKSGAQAQSSETRQQGGEQQGARESARLQRRATAPLIGAFGLSPFSLVRRMLEDMDRMFEGFGARGGPNAGPVSGLERGMGGGLAQVWSPAIDIVERKGRFVVRADLPGLSPNDVRIEVREDSLVLEGERRSEIEVEEEGGVYRSERVYGRFSRVIPLPDVADVEKASARFENGVLEIEVPLREEATRRRRIEIQGGSKGQGSGDSAVH
jgi:HSP20 family protein